jgi:hypothetical protein
MSLDAEIDKDDKLPPLLSHRRPPWANSARRFDQIGGTRTTLALSRTFQRTRSISRHALDHCRQVHREKILRLGLRVGQVTVRGDEQGLGPAILSCATVSVSFLCSTSNSLLNFSKP